MTITNTTLINGIRFQNDTVFYDFNVSISLDSKYENNLSMYMIL